MDLDELKLPIMLFDAKGREIKRRNITWFDEDTGEIEFIVEDEEGNLVISNDDLVRDNEFHPAPLTWREV